MCFFAHVVGHLLRDPEKFGGVVLDWDKVVVVSARSFVVKIKERCKKSVSFLSPKHHPLFFFFVNFKLARNMVP